MNYHPRIPSLDDYYCQVCSLSSSNNNRRYLSCFSCEHCRLSMCYECFEKHTNQLINEHAQLQERTSRLTTVFDDKRQFLAQFQEHCIRSVNSAFDEALNDLLNLRRESIDYVRQQFSDAEVLLSEMMTNIQSLVVKIQQNWNREGISKSFVLESEIQKQQLADIEHRLDLFSSPEMQIKMSTYPRNKLNLHCRPLSNSFTATKMFSAHHPGKTIFTRCSYGKPTALQSENIDVETEVEELSHRVVNNQQVQTDPFLDYNYDIDDEEDFYSQEEIDQFGKRVNVENCLSKRFIQQRTILTENEVDRIASDGEHLLYYSDTSKSLCYITDLVSMKRANGTSITKEISCPWPHHSILDLVYSPGSSQFVCATKTGVYTCTITKSAINIQIQLTQNWSYVRLSADNNYIWLWTDAPQINQLRIYLPKTFDCIKVFNLNDYPRFLDNSTSFCIHSNILATLFQFKHVPTKSSNQKIFHLTMCDSNDLHELCTIRLGECDIDHEIRVSHNGLFFVTNGRKKLWIVDSNGRKEYVKLYRTGRALAIHNRNLVIIANGTQQLQCVEPSENNIDII